MFKSVETGVVGSISNLFILLIAGALFAPLEAWLPGRLQSTEKRGRRFTDFLHSVINPAVAGVTALVLFIVVVTLVEKFMRSHAGHPVTLYFGWMRQHPPWFHLLGAISLGALSGYWLHRAFHASPILWRLHAVHHSSDRVDWLSAHRQHPLEVLLLVLATAGLPLLLGFKPQAVLAFAIFRKFHIYFSHANFRFSFGPWRWLLVMPRHHQWHHQSLARCNYAGLFPFLDLIFGTHHDPQGFPFSTTLDAPMRRGYIGQLLSPIWPLKKGLSPSSTDAPASAAPRALGARSLANNATAAP